eukprot:m.106914 g.106914  ORF g.106914 m.106914 type:complete len:391 (+) comp27758_c0_seq1:1425-2597(+)
MDCLIPLCIANSAPNLASTAQRLISGDRQSTSTTTTTNSSSSSSSFGIVDDPSSDIQFPSTKLSSTTKMASVIASPVRRNQNPPPQPRILEILSSSEHSTTMDTTGSDSDSSASSNVYSPSSDCDNHTHYHSHHQHDYPTPTTMSNDEPLHHQMRHKLKMTHKANSPRSSTSRKTRKPSPMKSTLSPTPQSTSLVHKPYMCRVDPYCAKVFRDASTRTRHEKVHSPNRYPCGVCGVEYSRKDNRNRHEAKCTSQRISKPKAIDEPSKLVRPAELVNQAALAEKLTGKLSKKQLQRIGGRGRSKVFRKTTTTQRTTPSSPLAITATLVQSKPSRLALVALEASDKSRKRAFMVNGILYKIQSQTRLFGTELGHSSRSGSDNAVSPTFLASV